MEFASEAKECIGAKSRFSSSSIRRTSDAFIDAFGSPLDSSNQCRNLAEIARAHGLRENLVREEPFSAGGWTEAPAASSAARRGLPPQVGKNALQATHRRESRMNMARLLRLISGRL